MESNTPQDSESRHADKYIVRFPDGMRERLKNAAKANNRTLNAEIVGRLQESLDVANDPTERAFREGFEIATLRAENERLKAERVQMFQARMGTDAVGKVLSQLPAELSSQYGLHLYRTELDRVNREIEASSEQFQPLYSKHQELIAAGGPPGPLSRSKKTLADLQKRIGELEEQARLLGQTISSIHIFREANGLPEIRNVQRLVTG